MGACDRVSFRDGSAPLRERCGLGFDRTQRPSHEKGTTHRRHNTSAAPQLNTTARVSSLTRSLAHSLTRSLAHSLTRSLAHSLTRSLAHSLTHSHTLTHTHTLTHSHTHHTEHSAQRSDAPVHREFTHARGAAVSFSRSSTSPASFP